MRDWNAWRQHGLVSGKDERGEGILERDGEVAKESAWFILGTNEGCAEGSG